MIAVPVVSAASRSPTCTSVMVTVASSIVGVSRSSTLAAAASTTAGSPRRYGVVAGTLLSTGLSLTADHGDADVADVDEAAAVVDFEFGGARRGRRDRRWN